MIKKLNLRFAVVVLAGSLLCGCKTSDDRLVNLKIDEAVYQDQLFVTQVSPVISPPSETDIFSLDQEIRNALDEIDNAYETPSEKTYAVVELIFKRNDEAMLYNSHANLTARESYHSRKANCLSLAVLAYSMVNYLDLHVGFQQVDIPEYWTHQRGISLLNNHVNIRVFAKPKRDQKLVYLMWDDIVIDFDPFSPKKKFPSKLISKDHILAMFYNNLGATAFVEEKHAQAYQYFKLATKVDPSFAGAWNNLGYLYRAHNHYDLAMLSYENALMIDKKDLNTLNNVAVLYEYQGEVEKAQQIHAFILRERQKNPYYHSIQGQEAYSRGELEEAVSHYKDALALDDSEHEFYFGLAKSYFALGKEEQTIRALLQARKYATQRLDRQRYEHKLSVLNQD